MRYIFLIKKKKSHRFTEYFYFCETAANMLTNFGYYIVKIISGQLVCNHKFLCK